MSSSSIRIRTLTDGGQQPLEIARLIAEFLGAAQRSLELAQYDFNLGPETREVVGGALREASARGVAVRIIYNVDHVNPIPVPPPPEPDVALIASLGIPARAVAGVPDLMHHKYVIRDGESVWSGSTNWTDDSWSRQENVIVTVDSPQLARAFTLDFEELWRDGDVERSGFAAEPRPVEIDGARVQPWFTPGFADALTHRIAKKIGHAEKVRICSPVITSAPVLATLAQRIADGRGDIAGCVDATQVDEVIRQWKANADVSWKLPLLQQVMQGEFSGKNSTPWAPGSLHDFMHAKLVVADDTVFVGSFNLSHSGEQNAENVLELADAKIAAELSTYVDEVRRRYPPVTPTQSSTEAST
jgi:phosphatidylserine/phosphatidylglycerophosphate/cardiolipin synthase-like enzyme